MAIFFAVCGCVSASAESSSSFFSSDATPQRGVENFDVLELQQSPEFTFTDANGNGFAEPGEAIVLSISLTNASGSTAENVSLQIAGGGFADYGTIQNNQTVVRTASYVISVFGPCGNFLNLTFNVSSSFGNQTFTRRILIGTRLFVINEEFDVVSAPNLPVNWTSAASGNGINWTTATGNSVTPPNALFVPNPASAGGADLVSPSVTFINVGVVSQMLEFRSNYNTDATWDGGVLEISVNGGAFIDVLAMGGVSISGGYNGSLRGNGNPLAGRQGWTGNSNGYITTLIRLPNSIANSPVRFRWRMGHDNTDGGAGWQIDSIKAWAFGCGDPYLNNARADFDGEGRSDLAVFRDGVWYVNRSYLGFTAWNWGLASDRLIVGDFDADNRTDAGVFRPSGSPTSFFARQTANANALVFDWGAPGDVPVIEDYDGDFKDDIAVYRRASAASNAAWYVIKSSGGLASVPGRANSLNTDKPIAGDFDGDLRADYTVFQNGVWYIQKSGDMSQETVFWGLPDDKPVPADYDGDRRIDVAVFRPSDGTWYIRKSTGGNIFLRFGISTDIPVPADYDGDGRHDIAVFRNGTWFMNYSIAGLHVAQFGQAGDKPIQTAYLPE